MTTQDYLMTKYGVVLTWDQACEAVRAHKDTLRKLCRTGKIKTPMKGQHDYILTAKAIADFLDMSTEPIEDAKDKVVGFTKAGYKKIV